MPTADAKNATHLPPPINVVVNVHFLTTLVHAEGRGEDGQATPDAEGFSMRLGN